VVDPVTDQAPPVSAEPKPAAEVRVKESDASVVGPGFTVTVTWRTVESVRSPLSETVRVTS
jgi:hypothetical protein